MSSTVGLFAFPSPSKTELQNQTRGHHGSVNGRLFPNSNFSRPSLPDLLASEGFDPKPEYTNGYVQKIRAQYLQLIAANNSDSENSHQSVSPMKSSTIHGTRSPKYIGTSGSNRYRDVSHDNIEVVEKPIVQQPKLMKSRSVDETARRRSFDSFPQDSEDTNSKPKQSVSSLRARFDQKTSSANIVKETLQPNCQPAPASNIANREKAKPSVIFPSPAVRKCQKGPEQQTRKAQSIQSAKADVTQLQEGKASEPVREATPKVDLKKKKEPVYGERVVIFKSRALQQTQINCQSKETQVQKPEIIISSVKTIEENQNMEWTDIGNEPDEFSLPDSFDEDEKTIGNCDAYEELNIKVVGGAASILAKPMWLRKDKILIRKLRFDDNVSVFGYASSEDENDEGVSPLQQTSASVSSDMQLDMQLGMRPISSLISNGQAETNSLSQQHCENQQSSLFTTPCARDALDMVF